MIIAATQPVRLRHFFMICFCFSQFKNIKLEETVRMQSRQRLDFAEGSTGQTYFLVE